MIENYTEEHLSLTLHLPNVGAQLDDIKVISRKRGINWKGFVAEALVEYVDGYLYEADEGGAGRFTTLLQGYAKEIKEGPCTDQPVDIHLVLTDEGPSLDEIKRAAALLSLTMDDFATACTLSYYLRYHVYYYGKQT